MKDIDFRRMCRLINALGKVRRGTLQKKMLKKCVRSRNVYENKQIRDILPGSNSDIYALYSDIFA
jgi:hypothetical protein